MIQNILLIRKGNKNLEISGKETLKKYIKLDIEHREYSTRTKPTPGKEDVELVNQIVAEELIQTEENIGRSIII